MKLTFDDVRDLASGYVLGALDAAEAAAIREHLASCPEAHAEIEALGGVIPYLAETLDPVEPPAGLRGRLLEAAAADRLTSAGDSVAVPVAAATRAQPAAPIAFPAPAERERRAAARTDRRLTWIAGIAAVLAVAVLGAWNLQLQSNLSGVQADLAAAQAYQRGVAAVLDIGTRTGAQTAFLAAAKAGLASSGVAAAAPDGTVVMAIHGLTPTAGSQVYEAWVIVGKDAPVALGGFTVSRAGTGVLRASTSLARAGAVLALTLEPVPGATAPAGPVVTAGSLTAPAG
ncbi:MAG: anti-sigma factor [Chloroflexi bacterium]|nr:anti-sigma factor [Chloroflexota bacterium]